MCMNFFAVENTIVVFYVFISDVRYVSIYQSKYLSTIQHVSVSIFLLIQFCII